MFPVLFLHCCYILLFRSEIITRWLAAMAKVGTVVIGRYFVVDVKLVSSLWCGICLMMIGIVGRIVNEWQWRGLTCLLPTRPLHIPAAG